MPLLVPAGLCAALPLCSCLEVARGVVEEPLAGTICLCEIVPELPASPRGVAIALLAGAMAAMAAAATAARARALLRVGRGGRGGMVPPGAGQISSRGGPDLVRFALSVPRFRTRVTRYLPFGQIGHGHPKNGRLVTEAERQASGGVIEMTVGRQGIEP